MMASPISSKICTSCKAEKPIKNFGACSSYTDGYRCQCNPCRSAKQTVYQKTEAGIKSRLAAQANRKPGRKRNYIAGSHRWVTLKRNHGISKEDYESRLEKQGMRCAICRTDDPKGAYGVFVVDHCHDTGRIRGLLCGSCNVALGFLGDTLEAIETAANYLRLAEVQS